MVPTQMNANALLNANYLYSIYRILLSPGIPLAFPDIPVGIEPVSLRTRRPWFLIHSALGEVSYAWRNRALIASERTSELAYPATVVLNSYSLRRERLAMHAMPGEIENERTS